VMEILRRSGIATEGVPAVVLGRSDIVGKPMALLLMHANATVTICHSKTRDLQQIARRSDLIIAAMGRTAMVTPEWIRTGATVIDVGINRISDPAKSSQNFRNGSSSSSKKVRHSLAMFIRTPRRSPAPSLLFPAAWGRSQSPCS
jgi:methylenetetrahydrofolate dehydrogenase (NADP+)/methenyltetrahydrofolate cyclohydrolase